ncbi:hypothetical protein SELMODRAFT_232297 [Selaginella moellendorffii]|uniref:Inositol-1-monophosphatase n=1 Tax=Selaginella moellendorffii TaxID=88036 RepID=D8RTD5_SELML|nr:hypothetical protein SELMODRAFT_232297 [Selaginella moellendorffii]
MEAGDELDGFLEIAVDAAKQAGQIIAGSFHSHKNRRIKLARSLFLSSCKSISRITRQALSTLQLPFFIGEETSALNGTAELTDEPTWIVDPLDGTTNFVHGFPFVCVSIGLTIGKVPSVGVVYNPILNELFTAVKGRGAFLNGSKITASSQDEIYKALLATEVGTKRDKATVDETTDRINNLLYKIRSLRMTGSCALNLCGVACGRLDIFYELGFGGPWDITAGVVILQEAGGRVFDPSGGPLELMSQRIAATNSHLQDAFLEALHKD